MDPRTTRALRLGAIAALVLVQALAFASQVVVHGYRPLGPPPVRVPLSWDMFAVAIDRCVVELDPPGASRRGPGIEWHLVRDDVRGYRALIAQRCYDRRGRLRSGPVEGTLRCALADHPGSLGLADLLAPRARVELRSIPFTCTAAGEVAR